MYINNNVYPSVTDLGVSFFCYGCGEIIKLGKDKLKNKLDWYKQVDKKVKCPSCGKIQERPELSIVYGYQDDDGDFCDIKGNKIYFDA